MTSLTYNINNDYSYNNIQYTIIHSISSLSFDVSNNNVQHTYISNNNVIINDISLNDVSNNVRIISR